MTPVMLINGLTRNGTARSSAPVMRAMFAAPAVMVFSECTTPLGRPVVPDVNNTTAGASRSGSAHRSAPTGQADFPL